MKPPFIAASRNLILALILSVSLAVTSAAPAFAAGWEAVSTRMWCDSTSVGFNSMLSWWGYFPTSWGSTTARLWRWNGNNWDLRATGYDTVFGGTNHTDVDQLDTVLGYWWHQNAVHTSSFFSGTNESDSGSHWC